MTSFLTQDCCRTMAFARASPRSEGQDGPTAGEIGAPRLGCSGIAFIRAHLSHGSRWNRWRPNARHAAAGSGGGRSSAISQCCRKRIEEIFGWTKTIGGLAQLKMRGLAKAKAAFTFGLAAYNLIRLPKLLEAPA